MPQQHDPRSRPSRRPGQVRQNSLVLYDPDFARSQAQRHEPPPPPPRQRRPPDGDARRRRRPEATRQNSLVLYDPSQSRDQKSPPRGEGVEIRRGELRLTYKVLPTVIGEGAFGKVRSCLHRERRKRLAVKSVPMRVHAGNISLLRNEISILTQLRHRHVVNVVDVVQDREFIHIVMEQCLGGDLFDMTYETKLGEGRVRGIVASLVDAVAYLHSKNIVHRDIKADHLMFSKKDLDSDVKIIDFGVSTIHMPNAQPLNAFAGSLRSVAPEVIKRSYDRACDLWSVGVTTYFLLTQTMPFEGENQNKVFQRIVSGYYRFPPSAARELSEEAKSFIDCLLQVDVRRRMSARVALTHPWLRGCKVPRQVASERQRAPERHYNDRPYVDSERQRAPERHYNDRPYVASERQRAPERHYNDRPAVSRTRRPQREP